MVLRYNRNFPKFSYYCELENQPRKQSNLRQTETLLRINPPIDTDHLELI